MKNAQTYRLIEVIDEQTRKEFFDLPVRLYQNDNNWSRPLDNEILAVLDPERNKLLAQGDSQCWILKDESGSTVGRIAAFYEKESAVTNEQPTGGVGFFECINDKDAAFMLFDAGKRVVERAGYGSHGRTGKSGYA